MKVHYIGLKWFAMSDELNAEIDRFKNEYLTTRLLCALERAMDPKQSPNVTPMNLEDAQEQLCALLKSYEEAQGTRQLLEMEQMARDILRELEKIKANPRLTAVAKDKRLRIFIKNLRQEYWLSWQDDLLACKVIQAYRECVKVIPKGDAVQRLFVVVFPEFTFKDWTAPSPGGFHKAVAFKFIHGLLKRNISRNQTRMTSLLEISQTLVKPYHEIIIFPGTVITKEEKISYNIAPVFYKGGCRFLWEKQTISNEDGRPFEVKHRHPVAFGNSPTLPGGGYVASSLTWNFLTGFRNCMLSPVFEEHIFGRKVSFAISICLDLSDHAIIGNREADIHILIAAGMDPTWHLENIRADKLFIYCDQMYEGAAMYKKGDSKMWPRGGCRWVEIDRPAMQERFSTKNEMGGVTGIYVAPNVEDI